MNLGTLWQGIVESFGGFGGTAQVFSIVLATLLLDFLQSRIVLRLQRRVKATHNPYDDAVLYALRKPLRLFIWVVGILFAAQVLRAQTDAESLSFIEPARFVGLVAAVAWFLTRLVHGAEKHVASHAGTGHEPMDRATAEALSKLARTAIIITASLVSLQSLGVEITAVLTFGGIGGLAVGLAARDLLANFFGGFTVYMDRPFSVGDWISSPDRTIEGVVEHIGWRQTRIRKFDKRPIYVPNSTFSTITVENPSRMTHRRINETIGVRYDDAEKVLGIVASVENMLRAHPDIDQSQTLMVFFNQFSASSLDFFIYTFTKTTVWASYHEVKQDVLLRIEKIIREAGAEMAFPTRTVIIPEFPFSGTDGETIRADDNSNP